MHYSSSKSKHCSSCFVIVVVTAEKDEKGVDDKEKERRK